ncbi:unnamed protein product [Callosobruchus maculatus]|uniref:Uncharacterized protein n=1 Tax=Callosobruchus maculatus TaxID=64391 RepID=A0A653BET9_CALMS|nr:unnamed protein product [Callosobruchus maculatus]
MTTIVTSHGFGSGAVGVSQIRKGLTENKTPTFQIPTLLTHEISNQVLCQLKTSCLNYGPVEHIESDRQALYKFQKRYIGIRHNSSLCQ